jgi:hypothetical protein
MPIYYKWEEVDKPWKTQITKVQQEERDAGCWWLKPIILATWEAEIGRIVIWGQSDNSWVWWHVPVIANYTGDWDQEDHGLRPAQGEKVYETPSQQKKKKAGLGSACL